LGVRRGVALRFAVNACAQRGKARNDGKGKRAGAFHGSAPL